MFKRIGAALVVALAGIFGVSGCMPMQGGTPATSTQHQTSVAGLPGVGEDGGLQFTVKGITTASTLGDPNSFIQSTAKGVYVVVSITVKNVSNETHSIDRMNTDALIDSTGRQYDSDYGAATNMSDSSTSTLQPESWAPLREAFDVPIGTTPNAIVMHGGMGTPGVKISLPPLTRHQRLLANSPKEVHHAVVASAHLGHPRGAGFVRHLVDRGHQRGIR